jgi:hypothetical protein
MRRKITYYTCFYCFNITQKMPEHTPRELSQEIHVNESQSIDINSINLNNHASNDCESPSGPDNIASRVKAKYSKARQKKIHRKSQHFTARN